MDVGIIVTQLHTTLSAQAGIRIFCFHAQAVAKVSLLIILTFTVEIHSCFWVRILFDWYIVIFWCLCSYMKRTYGSERLRCIALQEIQ